MDKRIIALTKEAIKKQSDIEMVLKGKLLGLRATAEITEKEIFKEKNVRESLECALEKLEEAKEREKK
jgi:hypothetical protein